MTAEAKSRWGHREPDPKYMTFVEHLAELRQRLIISVASIVVGSVIGWLLAGRVQHLLLIPLQRIMGHKTPLYFDTVYGAFTFHLKLAVIVGFAIALPVTISQLWAFVAPAFGPKANTWAPVWITSGLILFVLGIVAGYFVIPLALSFFNQFNGPDTKTLVFASQYLSFILLVLAVFGISFELPLVLVSMSAAGLTSSRGLANKRLKAFFGCFIFSTVATPGADWISPLVLGAILYVLYELSIWVSKLIGK